LLLTFGSGLAIVGALSLGSTFWLGGPNPSLWFIADADGGTISGWTLTLLFAGVLTLGIGLLMAARTRSPD
jgi:hypothetical protein